MTEITDEYMHEMLGKTKAYAVVILHAGENYTAPDAGATIFEHGRRNFALRAEGVLSIVGPVTDDTSVCGIGIFDAPVDEVVRIMNELPRRRTPLAGGAASTAAGLVVGTDGLDRAADLGEAVPAVAAHRLDRAQATGTRPTSDRLRVHTEHGRDFSRREQFVGFCLVVRHRDPSLPRTRVHVVRDFRELIGRGGGEKREKDDKSPHWPHPLHHDCTGIPISVPSPQAGGECRKTRAARGRFGTGVGRNRGQGRQ